LPDCHKYVTTGRQHTPTAIRRAIKIAMRFTVRSQNNILTRYGGRERAIVCNPLSRSAQSTKVNEVFEKELASAGRQKWTVGLHHMTVCADDILRNRVDDDSAAHQTARDELEDVVIRPRTVNRFAFQI